MKYKSLLLILLLLPLFSCSITPVFAQTNIATIIENLNHPMDVAVDSQGKLYFTEYGDPGFLKCQLPDGTVITLLDDVHCPVGVAIGSDGAVYFTEASVGLVKKYSPDSGVVDVMAEGLQGVWDIALDAADNMYVNIKSVDGSLLMIPAGGGAPVVLLENLNVPHGLTFDKMGHMYFVEFDGLGAQNGTLKQIPTWSSSREPVTLLEGLSNPYAVAVDSSGNIYFTEKIGQLSMLPAGGAEPSVLAEELGRIYGLSFDGEDNLYLTMYGSPLGGGGAIGKIASPPSDGGTLEDLNSRIDSLSSQLSSLKADVNALKGVSSDVNALNSEVASLSSNVEALRTQILITYVVFAVVIVVVALAAFQLGRRGERKVKYAGRQRP